jgi:hypothetical protein
VLKIIALFTMLIDHMGILFFNNEYLFRFIGRIAFPIFTMLIAYNYFFRTSNQEKYLKRLIIFGFISQPFYMFAFSTIKLNIFFEFVYGILLYKSVINLINKKTVKEFIIFICNFIFFFILSAYTSYGLIGMIFMLFSLLYFHYKKTSKNILLINCLLIMTFISLFFLNPLKYMPYVLIVMLFFLYIEKIENYKKEFFLKINKNFKYFFYWFYPIHLFILKIIQLSFLN